MSGLPKLMKAVVLREFGDPDNLRVESVPLPDISDEVILIRVLSAGVNAVDAFIREGNYVSLPELPTVLGKECCGLVEAVGGNVKDFRRGERVWCGLAGGGYAEYAAADVSRVFKLPYSERNLTSAQAAGLYIPYITAYRALVDKCRIRAGENLLIHGGTDAVGIAALQIARRKGLHVSTTSGNHEGLKMLMNLGAHHVYNHKSNNYLKAARHEIARKDGFDSILSSCVPLSLPLDTGILKKDGRIAVIGTRGPVQVIPKPSVVTSNSVVGIVFTNITTEEIRAAGEFVVRGIQEGWVNPIVGAEYSLEHVAQAHRDMSFTDVRGKLVLNISKF